MDDNKRKAHIQATFNTVAEGYDRPALDFFPRSAAHLVETLSPKGNERVLDVACGTGAMALALAEKLPNGNVTAVDFSPGMLDQARRKAAARGLTNIEFLETDMEALAVPRQHFDIAVCAFGIFFVQDMERQLRHIAETIRPGGKIAFTSFHESAFKPFVDLFFERIQSYGVELPPLLWKRTATEESCRSLCREAGLKDISVHKKDLGTTLPDASLWWDLIWYAGFRGLVNQLQPEDLTKFRIEHLEEVGRLADERGIRLTVDVLFTLATSFQTPSG